jgi:cyclopropane fatty-acyl-phospholipid synthase-like methyltransferase
MEYSLAKIIAYYQELGTLFDELSDRSHFFNLGSCEKGQKNLPLHEAQKQLVRLVAGSGDFRKEMRLLDVGCGMGGPAHLIADEIGCSIVGIDPGSFQVKGAMAWMQSQPGRKKITIHFGDAMHLPFKAGSFDRIYCIESAFHYPDKATFFKESARILTPDGMLIVADILRIRAKKESWLSRRYGKALAADNFFSVIQYQTAGDRAGLQFLRNVDITEKVRRTFPLWTHAFLKSFFKLAHLYSLLSLCKIGLALLLAGWSSSYTNLGYQILCFRKSSADINRG